MLRILSLVFPWIFASAVAMASGAPAHAQGSQRVILYIDGDTPGVKESIAKFTAALERRGIKARHDVSVRHVAVDVLNRDEAARRISEALRGRPALVIATSSESASITREATSEVPIVFGSYQDPVRLGLARSLADPGANLTGFTFFVPIDLKRLELLREIAPRARRLGIVIDHWWMDETDGEGILRAAKAELGFDGRVFLMEKLEDLRQLEAPAAREMDAWYVPPTTLPFQHLTAVVSALAALKKPVMFPTARFAQAGGLAAYQPKQTLDDALDQFAKLAGLVLDGVPPGTIPIERPKSFELWLNAAEARRLGMPFPDSLLKRADRVIGEAAPGSLAMKGSLFRKYAAVLMLFVGIVLFAGGAAEVAFNYAETRAQVELRQDVEARAAAARIRDYLRTLEMEVREMSGLPWGVLDPGGRLEESRRLLKLVPAISELRSVDAAGREQLRVSRIDPDEVGRGKPVHNHAAFLAARKDGIHYGGTYFKDGSEPYITIAVRDEGSDQRVTIAEVNLKFVGDLIREIRFGRDGRAFVIDGEHHLVAHPDVRHVLRKTIVSGLVPAASDAAGTPFRSASATLDNLDRVKVLTTYAPVGVAGWWVFVEQPTEEAFAPVYASIVRTVILFVAGIVLALAAAYVLARRLSQPILAVQQGAARLGSGDLKTRIDVRTGDEVEALADEFNVMASELQELYTGLERKVAEKTAELEAANRHKSEFLANMSHELRTPLNAIIGFSEVLKERMFGDLNPKQLEYVRDIYGSGQHLLSLINDILDLSKVEAGYMSLDIRDFDVPSAVKNCGTLIRERVMRQRLHFECAVDPAVTEWPADERKFKQVVLNLLSNAVKFTPAGGTVELRAKAEDGWLVLSVRDTGIGISPEDRAEIFKEFHQVRTVGSAKHEGTGLGLPLSRRLVELHHGTLTVESEPGRGSTFTARFPGSARRQVHG